MSYNIFLKKNKYWTIVKVILVNILLACVISIVCGFAFGYKFLNIVTGSMTPTMPVGTIVVVKKIPLSQIEVGDVVTYKTSEGSNVTHRVVEIINNGKALRTQGDAASGIDQISVTEKNLVGVVICYFKGLGFVFDIIKENIIFITIAVVLALFIITFS